VLGGQHPSGIVPTSQGLWGVPQYADRLALCAGMIANVSPSEARRRGKDLIEVAEGVHRSLRRDGRETRHRVDARALPREGRDTALLK
jgi:hypothetical protein